MTIYFGSIDFIVDSEETLVGASKAQTPSTKDLVNIDRSLRGLQLSHPQENDERWCMARPTHVEFVGMIDPVRDSFHDLILLLGSEYGHN
jgi:hypothetical protein